MKQFYSFLIGFIVCLAILAGLGFYFLFSGEKQESHPVVLLKENPGLPAKPKVRATAVAVVGSLELPPALRSRFKAKKGFIWLEIDPMSSFPKDPTKVLKIGIDWNGESTPVKFGLTQERLDAFVAEGGNLREPATFHFDYCYDTEGSCKDSDKVLVARTYATLPDKVPEDQLTIDLGKLFFTRDLAFGYRPEAACKPAAFSGKIIPTAEFLEKAPKGKKFVWTFMPLTFPKFNPNLAEGLAKVPQLLGEFTPEAGGTAFSIPHMEFKQSDYIQGFVAICDKGQDNAACMAKNFPSVNTATQNVGFRLVPAGFRYPHCSEMGAHDYVLHWFTPVERDKAAKGLVARERNGKLPDEVIEGQFL